MARLGGGRPLRGEEMRFNHEGRRGHEVSLRWLSRATSCCDRQLAVQGERLRRVPVPGRTCGNCSVDFVPFVVRKCVLTTEVTEDTEVMAIRGGGFRVSRRAATGRMPSVWGSPNESRTKVRGGFRSAVRDQPKTTESPATLLRRRGSHQELRSEKDLEPPGSRTRTRMQPSSFRRGLH